MSAVGCGPGTLGAALALWSFVVVVVLMVGSLLSGKCHSRTRL